MGYFAGIATYLAQNTVMSGGLGGLFEGFLPQAMAAVDVVSHSM